MASEKLYRNTLKHALRQDISNRQKWQRNKRPLDILVAYSNTDDKALKSYSSYTLFGLFNNKRLFQN